MRAAILSTVLVMIASVGASTHPERESRCGTDAPALGIVEVYAASGDVFYVVDRGYAHAHSGARDEGEGLYVYQETNGVYAAGASPDKNLQTGGDSLLGSLTPQGAGDVCVSPHVLPDTLLFCDPCDDLA